MKKKTKSGYKIIKKKQFGSNKLIEVVDLGDGVFMTLNKFKKHLKS